jgi:hypothetical protein
MCCPIKYLHTKFISRITWQLNCRSQCYSGPFSSVQGKFATILDATEASQLSKKCRLIWWEISSHQWDLCNRFFISYSLGSIKPCWEAFLFLSWKKVVCWSRSCSIMCLPATVNGFEVEPRIFGSEGQHLIRYAIGSPKRHTSRIQ